MAARTGSSTLYAYMGALTLPVSLSRTGYPLFQIPVTYVLKNQLHAGATEVSTFNLLTGIPIYAAFVFG